MKSTYIKWIEPYGDSYEEPKSFVTRMISKEEAIKRQIETVKRLRPSFSYENNDDALEDFLTVHWAEVVNIDE